MASPDLAKYETAVDKASAAWALDVARMIRKLSSDVGTRTDALRKLLNALPPPKSAADADFEKLGERINQIIAGEAAALKGLLELQMLVSVDAKAKRLGVDGYRLKGRFVAL